MPTIRNTKDLEKVIQGRLSLALKMTQQEVYKVIQKNIANYYKEKVFKDRETGMMKSTPNIYNRTFQFLNSLIKTKVITQNGVISCSVKIDTDSMHYKQDAKVVVDMINRGYHADTSLNDSNYKTPRDIYAQSNFWDDSISELGGYDGILMIMKKNCKKVGLPISN